MKTKINKNEKIRITGYIPNYEMNLVKSVEPRIEKIISNQQKSLNLDLFVTISFLVNEVFLNEHNNYGWLVDNVRHVRPFLRKNGSGYTFLVTAVKKCQQ